MIDDVRKGSVLDLIVTKLAMGGKGIAKVNGFVVFIDRAVPGQQVRVRITRKKKQFAEAKILEVLDRSPHQVEPVCSHFGTCGGCTWQDVEYSQQLHWKEQHVLECLEHLGGIRGATIRPIVPSPDIFFYRNKMEFTFSPRVWHENPEEIAQTESKKQFALGLHVRGFFDAVVNIGQCFLGSREAPEILSDVREWCRNSGLRPYSTRTHEGFWRFLVIREAKVKGELLVNLITTSQGDTQLPEKLAQYLHQRHPSIKTIVHSISDQKAQVATGETRRCLLGPGYIIARLGRIDYRISADSFFQTNTSGTEKLYGGILELGDFTGEERVWDLYCGTGSITLFIADRVRTAVGFELNQDAIEDARQNCLINNIKNCSFIKGDLKDMMSTPGIVERLGGPPDVIISDPPRAGMHPHVLKTILAVAPRIILTVSCNPATLARDLAVLSERYTIDLVQPFDMFPHTPHIECLVKLTRRV